MLIIFLIFSMLCLYNIYRRFTCIVKTKITKFAIVSSIVFLLIMFGITFYFNGIPNGENFQIYAYSGLIWLSFFTSVISAGVSESGFIHPWNLFARLYKWDNINDVIASRKENVIMISFSTRFTQYRQEYNSKDFFEIRDLVYKYKKKKLKDK